MRNDKGNIIDVLTFIESCFFHSLHYYLGRHSLLFGVILVYYFDYFFRTEELPKAVGSHDEVFVILEYFVDYNIGLTFNANLMTNQITKGARS